MKENASMCHKYTNSLVHEKSPYLLQHAHNPVNWYPWSDEAFAKAEEENKPIFLSIGYSTCHWCHVMERESFEDEEVAALLNERFIAIKVDREERPDIDQVYMSVCQAMTGQGGWPLTVFLTAKQEPFFAGTYFPKESRYGRPGLLDLLSKVAKQWGEKRASVEKSGADIAEQIKPYLEQSRSGEVSEQLAHEAASRMLEQFDGEYGGFGDAPKFPTPHQLMFLLRYAVRFERPEAQEVVFKTLVGMSEGGIYDHIGFGFSRYSTDRQWLVPHFEKMLYDNALMVIALIEAYQVTGNTVFAEKAQDVLTYLMRDMTSPEGGFYCAEDADSEGVEGKFYVWTPDEVIKLLGDQVGDRVCRWYDITDGGNFEGQSIPNHISRTMASFASELGIPVTVWATELREANRQLFEHRERRVHPYKDDKVLTSWNGLAIAALSVAGRVLGNHEYVEVAKRAVKFVQSRLVDASGRLLARFRDGHAAHLAYVDDYAFLTWGLTELYEATFEATYLRQAVDLQKELLTRFEDADAGGLFFAPADGESLIARPKEIYDGAVPSGNSVAVFNLVRLARLTGDTSFDVAAQRTLQAFAGDVAHYPAGHTFYLIGFLLANGPSQELVVAGWAEDPATQAVLREVRRRFLPQSVVLFREETESSTVLAQIAPFTKAQRVVDGKVTLYVCQDFACRQPTHDAAHALAQLGWAD